MKRSELYYATDVATADVLYRMNPWWRGMPTVDLPASRRHLVEQIKRRLAYQLARITVVRGSRQIGKTTAYLHVISDLLAAGIAPQRIFRVQFDEIESLNIRRKDPILWFVGWYEREILKMSLNETAAQGQMAYLFFDEVQNVDNWSTQLKFLADHHTFLGVVTGSSALRIEQGRDSLAGRVNTIEAGVLSLTEIGRIRRLDAPEPFLSDNGLRQMKEASFWKALDAYGRQHSTFVQTAFHYFAERGAYPIAHLRAEAPWELVADQLNETVIKRVIQHDLRVGDKGRKRDPLLLEEMFRWCCRYAGQAPGLPKLIQEIQSLLQANIGHQRVRAYLQFLNDTLLIRLIRPLEIRLKRQKSPPKLCLADHSLRASWLQEPIPLELPDDEANQTLAKMAGHIAESIVGALFCSISGLDVAYQPARGQTPEIDFVLTVGDQRIPIEIKYRNRIQLEDYHGLLQFVENPHNQAPFGLLITKGEVPTTDERIVTLPLKHLLLLR
ncbi:MAG: AAA family ATPase [Saprospiraceae bacterium]|nr:AAA family ATPase [Saprospiraceae bacterium]MDW8228236.1 AAA family ATPase [Saprospiraceae bacterium]